MRIGTGMILQSFVLVIWDTRRNKIMIRIVQHLVALVL